MDAAVAGKRKHFDTDEDASNRKVISSLTSIQNLIPSNRVGAAYLFDRKRQIESLFCDHVLINPPTINRG